MHQWETWYWQRGYRRILGMDEVGRGAIAGPVSVGGVIWSPGVMDQRIRDSKALTAKQRVGLAAQIKNEALAHGVASRDQRFIDQHGIVKAVQSCQIDLIAELKPDFLLLDAFALPVSLTALGQHSIVKGDQLSISIAAASIIAKVYRDALMLTFDEDYPNIGFGKHKGYGTPAHFTALATHGLCALHRRSFLKAWSDGNV